MDAYGSVNTQARLSLYPTLLAIIAHLTVSYTGMPKHT